MSEYSSYEPRVPVRSGRFRIRGVDYHVSEWGDGEAPLLVFLHGWGDAGASFQFVVDELGEDWHVIAPDWRGFGSSGGRAPAYWFPDYLADLDHLLMRFSPATPVRLVGHSMGANIAGLYAGALPERIAAFVNVEGFGLADSNPSEAPDRYRKWLEQGRSMPRFGEFRDFSALAKHIRRSSPRMTEGQARFVAEAWAEETNGGLELRADPAHKLPNAVLYRRAEAEACWRNVRAPVLLVAGGESNILEAFSEHLADGNLVMPFPDRRTHVIPEAGHMVHFEAPGELARAIETFLSDAL